MSPAELRQAIVSDLRASLGDTWVESPVPYELLPAQATRVKAHRSFAVGIGDSEMTKSVQRRNEGVWGNIEVNVAVLSRIRANIGRTDETTPNDVDDALSSESQLVEALRGLKEITGNSTGYAVRIDGISREVVGDGTFYLSTVRALAWFYYTS